MIRLDGATYRKNLDLELRTDFGNYVMPWPDYDAIPKNIRWFANHSVRGLYQEANYQSYGGDCAELKTYLMSKLMWDQSLNETDIVTEFLELYFSKSIAPHIRLSRSLDRTSENVELLLGRERTVRSVKITQK